VPISDALGVYRCFHCSDLHVAADHARRCAELGDSWFEGAVAEAQWIRRRGDLPWGLKLKYRKVRWTRSERAMWSALTRVLPREAICHHWWVPPTDYMVDFLIAPARVIVEVDGASHLGREGADRLRAHRLRRLKYDVVRVRNEDVANDAARIAAALAFRAATALAADPVEEEAMSA